MDSEEIPPEQSASPLTSSSSKGMPADSTYRQLIEGVTEYAIFMLDLKGNILTWNAGAERIKGYRAEDIIGSHFSRFYPADAVARGRPDAGLFQARESTRFEDEGWRLRKDGSRFWANVVITALRNASGELIGYSKITRDLTERHMQEERLRASGENFRLLIEEVKDHAFFLLDRQGRVMGWNAGAERVTGYRSAEVLGRDFSLFHPEGDILAGKPGRLLDAARSIGFAEETAWRVKRDGQSLWVDVTLTALREEDGSLRGFAQVMRDLSERRRVEELETEGRRITEFIAMLAHELRNPLAPIRNAVGVMEKKAVSPELIWCKDMIGRQVDHLAHLVDDLLEVSRITSGKIQLEREDLDLNQVVVEAVESVRAAVEELGHKLVLRLPERTPHFKGDAMRLAQVLVNLINNAAKYTRGKGLIQVELKQMGGGIYLHVRDNGLGMSGELIARAFDLFVQGDRGLDRSEGGLGIGLTLVKRIVALHGGTVTVSSGGPGMGSEFIVSLPAPENDVAPVQPVESHLQTVQTRNILVVDDNVDAANSLSLLLTMSGHELAVAHDGPEALQLAGKLVPDVMLLDIGLPGMNGYEVARRVRQLPALARTRLIAMTGYGQDSDRLNADEAGFDAYLVKPVDYAELMKTIDNLERKSSHPSTASSTSPALPTSSTC